MISTSLIWRSCIILMTSVILAVLFYIPYRMVEKKSIATHNNEQIFLTRQAAQGIENTFGMYGKALRYFAGHPSIIRLDTNGHKMLYDFYAIHVPGLVSVARLDQDGNVLHRISTTRTIDPEILERSFQGIVTEQPNIFDIINEDFILAAFAWPVLDQGVPKGSLVFLVSFSELTNKFLAPLKLAQGKRLWIINREGIVLECPNPEHSGAHITDTTKEVDKNSTLLGVMKEMVRGGHGEGSFEITDINKSDNLASKNHVVFMPILFPGGNYWSFAYATPENIVLANMRSFRNSWILTTSIALLTLLTLGCSLIRSMAVTSEEKKRRTVEEQLLELMDFTPIGIIVYDVHGKLLYANKKSQDIWLNFTSKQIDDINIFDFIHPDYLEVAQHRFKEVIRGKKTEPTIIKLLFPGNIVRSVEINTAPFYFSGMRAGVTVLQDVTERLEELEEQQRLATAVANTNDSIVITDHHANVVYVNPAFTRITGYSREEVIGKNPRILKSGFQGDEFYSQMWKTLTQGKVWEGRLVNKRKDGSTFTELASISPIRNAKGEINHFIAVKRDISHEVQLETQLQQAQKMEAIGTLAGGIAHDFNNILGAIIGFTDISLLKTTADSPIHDHLVQIKKSGQRAADLIQQILTFSRMAAHQEKINVAVGPLLKETIKLLRASMPTTIDINLELEEREGWVLADPIQIQQIIMNLCTNAFHAMSEAGGTLTIHLRKFPLGECSGTSKLIQSSCLEIKIADTGHGIDEAILDRIFDPFFTTKEPGIGTGMGLSVVHGIIQDLGGMITVDSTSGGTCFTVLLPETEPKTLEKSAEAAPLKTGTESILIVDDEQIIRDTCRIMLEQLGYRVTVSSRAREGLELIRDPQNSFDLVISDQTMPEMTGAELLIEVKKEYPELPVILCTGFSQQLSEETALQLGASRYVMKPINFNQLSAMVREVLDAAGQSSPQEEPSS